jgi:hypothetical protein
VKLAPGAYDVFLGEQVVASLVRNGDHSRRWEVELLVELPRAQRPSPLLELTHRFGSLEEACSWLGAEG